MEAAIAISGLLAALGVGAVGVGYVRRSSGSLPVITTAISNSGGSTITRDSSGDAVIASGILKFTLTDPSGKSVLVSTYSAGQTSAAARKQVAQDLLTDNLSVLTENGISAMAGQATAADFTRSTTQAAPVQAAVAAAAAAAATTAATNQANLDVELDAYIEDGFTLTEAEAAVKAGGESDPYADLQAKVYPGFSGSFNPATDKIVRVPWAPPGAPTSVGTPGGPQPTNYGLVVPQ